MPRDLTELLHAVATPPAERPDLGAAWRAGRRQVHRRTAALGVGVAAVLVALGGVGEAVLRPEVRFAGPVPEPSPDILGMADSVGPSAEAAVRCWELGSGWTYTESVEPDGRVSGNGSSAPAPDLVDPRGPDGSTLVDNGWSQADLRVLTMIMFAPSDAARSLGVEGTDGEIEAYRAELRDRLEGMQRCATIDEARDDVVAVAPAPAPAAVTGTLVRRGDCLLLERADGLTAALQGADLTADVEAGWLLGAGDGVEATEGERLRVRGEVAAAEVDGCPDADVVVTVPDDFFGSITRLGPAS